MGGKKGGRNPKPQEEEEEEGGLDISEQLSRNPDLLAALQAQLGGMVGASSGYIESLPAEVTKRVNALKNLQVEHTKLEVAFQKELLALEQKFFAMHQPLYAKRSQIVKGEYEPTAEEGKFKSDEEEAEEEQPAVTEGEAPKGIPGFWITVFQNNQYVAQMIEEHDMPVLEHLTDVTVEYFVDAEKNQHGYALHFFFSPNEYFKNAELVKKYFLDYEGEENQLVFDGPSYEHAEGCVIDWNDGKNVTVKIEKKKQKKKTGKDAGKTRTITKTVKQPSFFHFFSPPQPSEDKEEEDEDEEAEVREALMSADFEIGDIIKDKIIPCAVLWFTGDATMGDDEDDYDEGEEEGDGEGDDDDDEDDGDFEPPQPSPAKGGKGKGGKGPAGPPQNPECKQQ